MDYRKRAHKFYNSKPWIGVRDMVMMMYGYVCAHCGEAATIVDHITELNEDNINDPDIALNVDNCQPLCHECHNRKTFRKYQPTADGLTFNRHGELIRVEPRKDSLID